jgi:hypothetical protein
MEFLSVGNPGVFFSAVYAEVVHTNMLDTIEILKDMEYGSNGTYVRPGSAWNLSVGLKGNFLQIFWFGFVSPRRGFWVGRWVGRFGMWRSLGLVRRRDRVFRLSLSVLVSGRSVRPRAVFLMNNFSYQIVMW